MAGALCMASLQASLAQCSVASRPQQQKQKSWDKAVCFRVPARACSAPLRLQAFSGLHSSNPLQLRTDPGFESSSLGIGNGSKWFAMRHGRKVPKLGRPADQRRALLRGLTTELLRHGRIKTTQPRAKAMRKYVDHMITLAKGGSLHQRRQALGFLYDKQLVHSIFAEVPGRYGERNGGYTRIIRTMPRRAALEVDCRALGGQRFRNAVKGGNFVVAKRGETRRDQKPKKYPRWDPSKKAQNSFKKLPKGDTFLREDDAFGTLQTASGENILLREDQAVGQVVAAQANIMRVIVLRGGSIEDDRSGTLLLCYVRALLKKIKKRVLVGDNVLISGIDWTSRRGMVEDVLDRKSEILDPPVANVDHLVVLFALDRPKLEPVALSRFLVEAESMDIPFTVVLNKADLVSEEVIQSWRERLSGWGYDPIFCSVSGNTGLSSLAEILKPRTTVVVGPSGVGKSSLINALGMRLGAKSLASLGDSDEETCGNPEEACAGGEHPAETVLQENELLAASEVSERSGKGRHTTRNVTLLELSNGGGRLVDTPGFSQPSLGKLTSTSVADCFPEITARLDADESGGCAFADCMHVGEPNCVVGGGWDRYSDYVGFLTEVRKREELQKRVLGTKQESKVRYKTGTMGILQAEPRLVSSKHRRESRKSLTQSVEGDVWEQRQDQQEVDELSLLP